MKQFKELGIKPAVKHLLGDKIKMDRILNREIVVTDFKIEDSKIVAGEKCLHMQIKIGEIMHVVFTGAKQLIIDIQQIALADFPFTTTIVKEEKTCRFT